MGFFLNVGVAFSENATSDPIICRCSDCGGELDRLLPCIFRFNGELGVHWLSFRWHAQRGGGCTDARTRPHLEPPALCVRLLEAVKSQMQMIVLLNVDVVKKITTANIYISFNKRGRVWVGGTGARMGVWAYG